MCSVERRFEPAGSPIVIGDPARSKDRARSAAHERNERQAGERTDSGGSESVLVGQHIG